MVTLLWIVCASLVVRALAQGSLGGQQYPPCSTAAGQASQYYGCWNISPSLNAGQAFYNLSIVGTAASISYYPGWVSPGGLYDDSVNPANCTIACRGHGYKFSALYNGQYCYCGSYPPTIPAPLSSLDPYDTAGNSCHRPGTVCYGDASQFCGAKDASNPNIYYADVYVDNSFPLSINPSVEQNNYAYYGCFHGTTFEYIPNSAVSTNFMTAQQCFYECSSMGFSLAQIAGGAYSNCQCGTEVPQGNQVADSNCKSNCAGGTTCNPLTGTICCGRNGNNPIYIDANLVGCYQPSNPGFAATVSYSEPTNAPTTIGMKTTASYPGPVVIATNPPSAPPYLPGYPSFPLKGCFNRGGGGPIVSGFGYIDSTGMTVDSCLRFCSQYAFYYLSLTGGNTCACSIIAISILATQVATENCHILCPGNLAPNIYEYCGGSNYEQIYGNFLMPFVSSMAQSGTTTTTTTISRTTSSSITTASSSRSTASSSSLTTQSMSSTLSSTTSSAISSIASSTLSSTSSSTWSSMLNSVSSSALSSTSSSISSSTSTSASGSVSSSLASPSSSSSSSSSTPSSFPSSSSLLSSSSSSASPSSPSSSTSSSSSSSSASLGSLSSLSSSSSSISPGSSALTTSSSSSSSPSSQTLSSSSGLTTSSSGFTTVASTTNTPSTSSTLSSSVSIISSSQASGTSASLSSVTSLVSGITTTIIQSSTASSSIGTASVTGLPSTTFEVSTSSGSSFTNSVFPVSTRSPSISTSASGLSTSNSGSLSAQLSLTQTSGVLSSTSSFVRSISSTAIISESSHFISSTASAGLTISTAVVSLMTETGSGTGILFTGANSTIVSIFTTVSGASGSGPGTGISLAPATGTTSGVVSSVTSNSGASMIVFSTGSTRISGSEVSETRTSNTNMVAVATTTGAVSSTSLIVSSAVSIKVSVGLSSATGSYGTAIALETTLQESIVFGTSSMGSSATASPTSVGELSGLGNPGTMVASSPPSLESSMGNSEAITTGPSTKSISASITMITSNSASSITKSAAGTIGSPNSEIFTSNLAASTPVFSGSNTQSSPIPASTSDTQYIIQVNIQGGGSHNLTGRNFKRQIGPGYLGTDSSAASTNCSSALPFTLVNGELSINGQLVSTNPGVPFQLLVGSPFVLGITRTFSIVNGTLVWQSSAFADNSAIFCQVASGDVYAEFAGPLNAAYPFNCVPALLAVIPESFCQNGVIVYPTESSSQTSPESTQSIPITQTGIAIVPVLSPTQASTGNAQTAAPTQTSKGTSCKFVPPNFYKNGTEPIPLEECLKYTFTSYIGSCTYEALPTPPYA